MSSQRFSGSIGVLAPTALLAFCVALGATARAAAPQVALLPFDDPRPAYAERWVEVSLDDAQIGYWPSGQVHRRLSAAGIAVHDPQAAAKTAALLRVPLVIREHRGGGQLVLTVLGSGGEVVAQLRYPMRRGFPYLRSTLAAWWPGVIEKSWQRRVAARGSTARPTASSVATPVAIPTRAEAPAPTPSATPAPTETTNAQESAPPAGEATQSLPADQPSEESPWPAVVDFSLGGGSLSHWLDYNQDLFNSLGNYTLIAGPLVAGGLAFYPGALWTRGVFAHIGLLGEFNHTTGVASSYQNQSYPTLDDRWTAGLRIRIPIATSEMGVSGRYGEQDFRLGVLPGSQAPPVPDYTYTFVQGGLDARVQLGPVAILADGAYMDVLTDGISASGFFPHAQVGAVATGLHLGIRLWEGLELRLGADYQRYFFTFNPSPGDAHVAGGAVDQYLAATLALGVLIR